VQAWVVRVSGELIDRQNGTINSLRYDARCRFLPESALDGCDDAPRTYIAKKISSPRTFRRLRIITASRVLAAGEYGHAANPPSLVAARLGGLFLILIIRSGYQYRTI
jgi:hypothetical protein